LQVEFCDLSTACLRGGEQAFLIKLNRRGNRSLLQRSA
jgi:hypothetical protein